VRILHQAPVAVTGDLTRASVRREPRFHGTLRPGAELADRPDLVHAFERLQVIMHAQDIAAAQGFTQEGWMIFRDREVVLVHEPGRVPAHPGLAEDLQQRIQAGLSKADVVRAKVAVHSDEKQSLSGHVSGRKKGVILLFRGLNRPLRCNEGRKNPAKKVE